MAELARLTGSAAIAALDGATLLGERAVLGGFRVPGLVSAGGGCRLYDAADGVVALNLARASDRELLPALFEDGAFDAHDDRAIAAQIASARSEALVARGREMGLAIAAENEAVDVPADPVTLLCEGAVVERDRRKPRALDLSSLWAGPLCGHLLWLAAAEVVKVESHARPDAMREDATGFFDVINQGKASVALDFGIADGRASLLALIAQSDIVIEASRPRALLQLGIDADEIVRTTPGLVWLTLTAHGATTNSVGFGDDVAVAAGLSAALRMASGRTGFVGDAIADPLTGICGAVAAWQAWQAGRGGRYGIAMRDVAACFLAEARAGDADGFNASLKAWSDAEGQGFCGPRREVKAAIAAFGADTQQILSRMPC